MYIQIKQLNLFKIINQYFSKTYIKTIQKNSLEYALYYKKVSYRFFYKWVGKMAESRDMPITFTTFLSQKGHPKRAPFLRVAKHELQKNLGRWSNAFEARECKGINIAIPNLDKLVDDFIGILKSSKITESKQEPQLTAESKKDIDQFLDKIFAITCQEVLDEKGNLRIEIIEAFNLLDESGNLRPEFELKSSTDRMHEFRNGFLAGFFLEIYSRITSSAKYLAFYPDWSHENLLTNGVVLSTLDKYRQDQNNANKVIKNYIKPYMLQTIFSSDSLQKRYLYNYALSDPLFLESKSIEEYLKKFTIAESYRLQRQLETLKDKLTDEKKGSDYSNRMNEALQGIREEVVLLTSIPPQKINFYKIKACLDKISDETEVIKREVLQKTEKPSKFYSFMNMFSGETDSSDLTAIIKNINNSTAVVKLLVFDSILKLQPSKPRFLSPERVSPSELSDSGSSPSSLSESSSGSPLPSSPNPDESPSPNGRKFGGQR